MNPKCVVEKNFQYIDFLKKTFRNRKNTIINKNFRKFESFKLRYTGSLEQGILKLNLLEINKEFGLW